MTEITKGQMKAVAWKEWRENRSFVTLSAAAAFVGFMVPCIDVLIGRMQPKYGFKYAPEDISTFINVTLIIWLIAGIYRGCAMIAPEVGSGSFQFLTALPISRKYLWWAKVLSGLGVLYASIAASTATMAGLCILGEHTNLVNASYPVHVTFDGIGPSILLLAVPAALFAIGTIVSMLIDNVIAAFVLTAISSAGIAALLIAAFSLAIYIGGSAIPAPDNVRIGDAYILLAAFLASVIAASGRISFVLFQQGETLKTRKRFSLLLGYVLPPVVIIAALAIAALTIVG
jgi:ABC-type transport system involved in multi-copper enzyme maturation permease subunit